MKILLGQLGANGDCLYATTIARQLKHDFPNSELTWAISQQCEHLLVNNPHVDHVWSWPIKDWAGHISAWYALERSVLRDQQSSEPFDRVYLTQILPGNIRHYDGTCRPSIFRALDREITVPIDSVIELTDREKSNVDNFARKNQLGAYGGVVLFECSSKSGQSRVTPGYAIKVAESVSRAFPDCCFILSTHEEIATDSKNIISAKELTMRENAALTQHCSLFIGCGSGLTVVATSSAAKAIPNIQILTASKSVYASFYHDFLYFNKPADRFVEMGDASEHETAEAVTLFLQSGIDELRTQFHRPIEVNFNDYIERVERWAIRQGRYIDALESLKVTAARYGWHRQLVDFGKKRVARLVPRDPLTLNMKLSEQSAETLEFLLAGVN